MTGIYIGPRPISNLAMTYSDRILNLGRFFYRYRAVIAVPFFILLVLLSNPLASKLTNNIHPLLFPPPFRARIMKGDILILLGMAIRIWAAGYIGPKSRSSGFLTDCRIINGPYQYLKHPLYIGNFFLVLGVVVLYNPPVWLATLLLIVFLTEYAVIIIAETSYLKHLSPRAMPFSWQNVSSEISTTVVVALIYSIFLARFLMALRQY